MAKQIISIENRHCDWDEMMDACEIHELKPHRFGTSSYYSKCVSLTEGDVKITWRIKPSLMNDWQSYWTEREA